MNYCLKGREMLLDLKRSEWLPVFDEDGVRILINEVCDIHNRLKSIITTYEENYPDPVRVSITYYHQCLSRNQRYINWYI
jgi:GINS complex subunit 1